MSFVGEEGRADHRQLSLLKPPGPRTPTVLIPLPDQRATPVSKIQKLYEPSWDKIEKLKKIKENLQARRAKKPNPLRSPRLSSSAPSSPKKTLIYPPLPKSVWHTPSKLKESTTFRCRRDHYSKTPLHILPTTKPTPKPSHTRQMDGIKRNRSHESTALAEKRKKPPYLPEKDVWRESRGQAERMFAQTRNPKDLKWLWNFHQFNGKDVEIPENFQRAKRLLTWL